MASSARLKPNQYSPVSFNQSVSHLLSCARFKLLADEIPIQLKAISYLRLCCIAIQKIYQPFEVANLERDASSDPKTTYSNLLAQLCEQDAIWWQYCWVSDRGILKSNNPAIDILLQPLGYFVELFSDDLTSNQHVN